MRASEAIMLGSLQIKLKPGTRQFCDALGDGTLEGCALGMIEVAHGQFRHSFKGLYKPAEELYPWLVDDYVKCPKCVHWGKMLCMIAHIFDNHIFDSAPLTGRPSTPMTLEELAQFVEAHDQPRLLMK